MRFDLICIDMFQTLVDVDNRIPFIWQRILRDKYTDEAAANCAKLISQKLSNAFHERVNKSGEFRNLKSIFNLYFEEIAAETELGFDFQVAADVFLSEHGDSKLYDDALKFFELIGGRLPICLVSDADNVMIKPLIPKLNFDSVFISENVGSYKNDPESRIFNMVLKHYQVKPEKVLHIGDSASDIIGASKAGIKSCWINRNGLQWKYPVKPDYIVRSLVEVMELLG
ncbi:MAG TPA: HAD family hydrolase [Clostridia bacterium]|nr:HAD family hydrolase [Clostridia bacterium]